MPRRKVPFPIDKKKWSPSLIPGVLVLVSTHSKKEEPNVAPKSWVQMVAFDPPTLMFSGTKGNTTENNVLATGGFGINIVDAELAPKVFSCLNWYGAERIEKLGLHLTPADKINAPLVAEAKACLECKLVETKEIGTGLVVFGEIVGATIDEEIAKSNPEDRYKLLNQALFLESKLYASLSDAAHVK